MARRSRKWVGAPDAVRLEPQVFFLFFLLLYTTNAYLRNELYLLMETAMDRGVRDAVKQGPRYVFFFFSFFYITNTYSGIIHAR